MIKIGSIVSIINPESMYFGEWGRVMDYEDGEYFVAIADDSTQCPIFDRSELKVNRNLSKIINK